MTKLSLASEELTKLSRVASEEARQDLLREGDYVDTEGNQEKVRLRKHTVVFGRRGSGKTTLLKNLTHAMDGKRHLWVDADEYKNLTYPDTLIQLFRACIREFTSLIADGRRRFGLFRSPKSKRLLNELSVFEIEFKSLLNLPDESEYTRDDETSASQRHLLKAGAEKVGLAVGAQQTDEFGAKKAESYRTTHRKEDTINRQFQDFKSRVKAALELLGGDVYFVMDDFYHLRVDDQANVLDYLGRLFKNLRCYVKFGTIYHRSCIYKRGKQISGFQLGHDVEEINLDRTFKNFDAVDSFLHQIFHSLCKHAGVSSSAARSLYAGDSWRQHILASGGVPRDFMNILVRTVELGRSRNMDRVNVRLINEAANGYYRDTKLQDLKQDSDADDKTLAQLLNDLKRFCMAEKKLNVLLIGLHELETRKDIEEALQQLCDFRFLHEIHDATSSVNVPGKRFKAYLLDLGIYAHPERRGDNRVHEIEFWHKDEANRMDAIRKAPVYELKKDYSSISDDLKSVESEPLDADYEQGSLDL